MEQPADATALFPSNQFLAAHYGPNCPTGITLRATNEPLMMFSYVRNQLDGCFRSTTMTIMRRIIDTRGPLYRGVYVVKNGIVRPWVRKQLLYHDFTFTEDSEAKLAQEFIAYYHQKPFYHDDWWEWFVTDDSIGAKLTEEANPHGGNRKRRSLSELFGE